MTNLIEFSLLSFLSETRGVCDPSCVVLSPLYSSHSETNLSRFFTDSLLVVFCLAVLRVLCAWSESLSFQVGGGDDAGKVVTLFFMWTYLSISSISDYNECESGGICHNTTITGAPMRWREERAKGKQPRQQKIFPAKANNHTQLVVSFLAAEIVLLSFMHYTVVDGRVASSINWTTQHTTQQHNIKLFRVQHSSERHNKKKNRMYSA